MTRASAPSFALPALALAFVLGVPSTVDAAQYKWCDTAFSCCGDWGASACHAAVSYHAKCTGITLPDDYCGRANLGGGPGGIPPLLSALLGERMAAVAQGDVDLDVIIAGEPPDRLLDRALPVHSRGLRLQLVPSDAGGFADASGLTVFVTLGDTPPGESLGASAP